MHKNKTATSSWYLHYQMLCLCRGYGSGERYKMPGRFGATHRTVALPNGETWTRGENETTSHRLHRGREIKQ